MLVALADTHGRTTPRLTPHLREALADADAVVHAGDFRTGAVLDAFEERADRLTAVYGNTDSTDVCERLPETGVIDYGGDRFVVAHGHRHDELSLSLLARQEAADVAIVGHSHRPVIVDRSELTVVNPGSHADPRGNRAAYARFERSDAGLRIELRSVEGEVFDTLTRRSESR